MESSEHEKEKIERLRRAMYSRSLADKIRDRARRPLAQRETLVGDDFVERQESVAGIVVAPRTIGLARTTLWWLLAAAAVFFIGTAAYFGYYFVFGSGSLLASPGSIGITVAGP